MILSQKSMDGTNLYIVLDYEKIKFVLTTPRPNELVADASQ